MRESKTNKVFGLVKKGKKSLEYLRQVIKYYIIFRT